MPPAKTDPKTEAAILEKFLAIEKTYGKLVARRVMRKHLRIEKEKHVRQNAIAVLEEQLTQIRSGGTVPARKRLGF